VADVVDEVVTSTCLEYDIPHQTSSGRFLLVDFQDEMRRDEI